MAAGTKGILHEYAPKLVAFEYASISLSITPINVLIFIGGLGDGLLTVPYAQSIALSLPPTWSLAQPILSSSYSGWGTASLKTDVAELSSLVSYFRSNGKTGKIVLLGHSTGCQDVMEYLTGEGWEGRAKIQGGLLQASVSDREALGAAVENLEEVLDVARKLVDEGNGEEILPTRYTALFGNTPITARRFLSLGAVDGDDDYFSTDLSDEKLASSFGKIPKDVGFGILFSGSDEYVGKDVDRKALVDRWLGFVRRGGGRVDEERSGVVEGATHNLRGDDEKVVQDLVRRVVGFLEWL